MSGARRPRRPRPRSLARLAAVQALYQLDFAGGTLDVAQVLEEFREERIPELTAPEEEGAAPLAVDLEWFETLVRGAWARQFELDRLVQEVLRPGWTVERLGYATRALLRAAAFELLERREVPWRVVIDEYVEIAKQLLGGEEPAWVNVALDRLAKLLRKEEVAG